MATHGGDVPTDSNISLLVVGLAGVSAWATLAAVPELRGDRVFSAAAVLFPVYVAFQLVPLPLALVRLISPARAAVADALGGVMAAPHFAPLTIAPPTTWTHLSRIVAYAVVFLLVRQIARQTRNPWMCCAPLILIGAAEAAWALFPLGNEVGAGEPMSGSYFNKNHLAGLLEMILPFAVVFGWRVVSRGRERGALRGVAALKACAPFAAAAGMLLGGDGFVVEGGCPVHIRITSRDGRIGAGKPRARLETVGSPRLFAAAAIVFVFVTPPALVEQFGVIVEAAIGRGSRLTEIGSRSEIEARSRTSRSFLTFRFTDSSTSETPTIESTAQPIRAPTRRSQAVCK